MSILDNTTSLEALLEKANNLSNGGSSGGGSVETCTVRVNGTGDYIAVNYTDGNLQYVESTDELFSGIPEYGAEGVPLTNVLCNSIICFTFDMYTIPAIFEIIGGTLLLSSSDTYFVALNDVSDGGEVVITTNSFD